MAKAGKYGPRLQEEAGSIQTLIIPYSLYRTDSHKRHQKSVLLIGAAMFVVMGLVIGAQSSDAHWLTKELRVEFRDPALHEYSGCYEIDPDREYGKRNVYNSHRLENSASAVFAFCDDERHWVLLQVESDGDNDGGMIQDPCADDKQLIHSAGTDTYDIWSSFGEPVSLFIYSYTQTVSHVLLHTFVWLPYTW